MKYSYNTLSTEALICTSLPFKLAYLLYWLWKISKLNWCGSALSRNYYWVSVWVVAYSHHVHSSAELLHLKLCLWIHFLFWWTSSLFLHPNYLLSQCHCQQMLLSEQNEAGTSRLPFGLWMLTPMLCGTYQMDISNHSVQAWIEYTAISYADSACHMGFRIVYDPDLASSPLLKCPAKVNLPHSSGCCFVNPDWLDIDSKHNWHHLNHNVLRFHIHRLDYLLSVIWNRREIWQSNIIHFWS